MTIFLIAPNAEPKRIDTGPATLAGLRELLACRFIEHIPGLSSYEGSSADMYGDEEAGLNDQPFNHKAVELRDAGLVAGGHRPSANPVQGAVVIVTGADRLA